MVGTTRKSGFTEEVEFPTSRETLGRYELLAVLGQGGMASVHLARTSGPSGFSKLFAIKRIHPMLANDERFVDMFLDEARVAAALHHPNIAQVFELGEDRGRYFLAMEYLHGEPLSAVLARLHERNETLPIPLACRIVAQVAEALHHAHEAHDTLGRPLHVVHRDVSPQNVFITYGGNVKLTDFGVAKASSNIVRTDTGAVKGKFAYMAPEQALGQPIDARTDLFALGTVLWECLTGTRLFRGTTDAETLLRVSRCEVAPPRSLRSEVPEDLDGVVLCLLAADPSRRFDNAAALARALSTFCRDVSAGDLAQWMHERFAGERARKDALVSDGPAGEEHTAEIGEPDTTQPTSGVSTRTLEPGQGARAEEPAQAHEQRAAPPSSDRSGARRYARLTAVLVVVALVALGGGALGAKWFAQETLLATPRVREAALGGESGSAHETERADPIALVLDAELADPVPPAPVLETQHADPIAIGAERADPIGPDPIAAGAPGAEGADPIAPVNHAQTLVREPAPRVRASPRPPAPRVNVSITVPGGASYGHVWIDGRERDVPGVLELPAGAHTFRYRIADGPIRTGRATITPESRSIRLEP